MARNSGTCGTCFYARDEKGNIPSPETLKTTNRFICFGCPPASTVVMLMEKSPLGVGLRKEVHQSRATVVKEEPACALWERRSLLGDGFESKATPMFMAGGAPLPLEEGELINGK